MFTECSGKILILGADGFIGKNLFNGFKKSGFDVMGTSRSGKHIQLDIVKDNWREIIANECPSVIVNCIAYGNSQNHTCVDKIKKISYDFPKELIEFCHDKLNLKAFIQLGSSSEYGTNCKGANELFDLNPNSEYSIQKGRLSEFSHGFAYTFNFPLVYFRLFSVYGEGEHDNRLIPTLVREASRGKFPLLGSEKVARDFIHIDDVVKAIKLGVELVDSAKGSIFNICSEQNITLKKLCSIVQREFKLKESPNFGKRPNHTWDLKYWYGNSSKAKKVLGWEPTISLETYFAQEFKKVVKHQ